jgi:hypothetical protein
MWLRIPRLPRSWCGGDPGPSPAPSLTGACDRLPRSLPCAGQGLRLLAPGGRLVYSTCSIAPLENDGVVARALSKMGARVRAAPPGARWPRALAGCAAAAACAATEHGMIALPDAAGCGPLYWAVLEACTGAARPCGAP